MHLGLVFKQKHTQWPGPGRTNHNVVGERMFPRYAIKQGGFFMVVFGVIALMGGLFQINPIWLFGPYEAAVVSAGSQPDWYVMFLDGSTRLMPAWEITIPIGDGYTIPALFWPTVVLPGILTVLPMFYPFIEARLTQGQRACTTCCSVRGTCPTRTGLGAMAIAFYMVLTLSGGNDVIADKFDISLNAMTWAGRIGLLVAAAAGLLRRLPDLPRPAAARPRGAGPRRGDRHHPAAAGRPVRRGAPAARRRPTSTATPSWSTPAGPVPKKMNRLGALGPAIKGFFFPIEKPAEAPVSPGHPPVERAPRAGGDQQRRPLTSPAQRPWRPPSWWAPRAFRWSIRRSGPRQLPLACGRPAGRARGSAIQPRRGRRGIAGIPALSPGRAG